MEEVISLLSEVLSWPWPKIRESNSVTKTGMGTDLIEPDILFEPIFIQESLITLFQRLYQSYPHSMIDTSLLVLKPLFHKQS